VEQVRSSSFPRRHLNADRDMPCHQPHGLHYRQFQRPASPCAGPPRQAGNL